MSAPLQSPADTTFDALRRTISRNPVTTEPTQLCQLCNAPIPEGHRHLLDEQSRDLLCACQACKLLFEREAAGKGRYRLIPNRRLRLPAFATRELGIPVGLAFFVRQFDGQVVAHYPSALGVTQWEVDAPAWQALNRERPEIESLSPVVEAVLINTTGDRAEHWIVPIDDCYRLVAVVRTEWRGIFGGSQVWPAIDRFFAVLHARPHPLR